jgi:hypothetical protein
LLSMLRFWREGLIGALLVALGLVWIGKAMADRQNAKLKTQLGEASALIAREREQVRGATALARAQDAAHAARIERDQSQISEEVANDYETQLGDLRRRYDALRLQRTAAANPGGGAGAAMPGVSAAAGGADGAAGENGLPAPDEQLLRPAPGSPQAICVEIDTLLIASEIALRLRSLQDWVRGQALVDR